MKFRELMLELAERIGRHHLPISDHAHEIGDFLGQGAIHHQLVSKFIKAVYKANRCGHLNADIALEPTFDAVGRLRGEIIRAADADLDIVRLIDQIGEQVSILLAADTALKPLDAMTAEPGAPLNTALNAQQRSDADRENDSATIKQFVSPSRRSAGR